MFYGITFFVKQKTFFFSSFIEMHISDMFVNNQNILSQEHICHISLLLNIVCLDVWVGLYYFALIILLSFEFHYGT